MNRLVPAIRPSFRVRQVAPRRQCHQLTSSPNSFNGYIEKPSWFKTPTLSSSLFTRRYVQSSTNRYQMPKTPDLIYMPHLIRWMKSKLNFKYLQKAWDREFSEGAFIYGSTQAVCRITQIISQGDLDQLNGLMTVSAKIKLKDDVTYRLTQNQKRMILLRPEDIKILVPISVNFHKEGLSKICRIMMRALALKWFDQGNENYRLVLVALQTEFSRDYGERATNEWIVSSFNVLECAMLTEATANR